jgi:hypothetical protein
MSTKVYVLSPDNTQQLETFRRHDQRQSLQPDEADDHSHQRLPWPGGR